MDKEVALDDLIQSNRSHRPQKRHHQKRDQLEITIPATRFKRHHHHNRPSHRHHPQDRWRHDLYQGGDRIDLKGASGHSSSSRLVNKSLAGVLVSASEKKNASRKIRIDNLYYEVTAQDLQQLFVSIGPVARVDLIYDNSGRPSGSATVLFTSVMDAVRALEKFHGVPLDGMEMSISVIPMHGREGKNSVFDRLGKRSVDASLVIVPGGEMSSQPPQPVGEFEEQLQAYLDAPPPSAAIEPMVKGQKNLQQLEAELDAYIMETDE